MNANALPGQLLPARFAHLPANATLPRLVRYNAIHHASEVSLREKEFGIWKPYTFAQVYEPVREWMLGLHERGVVAGDTVAIISDSRPDWICAAVATHGLRAMTLGLYQDALDTEVSYLLKHAQARVVIAENEEQVDKMLKVCAEVPSVTTIVYNDSRGMRKYKDSRLLAREALFELGRARAARQPELVDSLIDATQGSDVAVLCSTSGTTSNPKLVCLAGEDLVLHVANYCELMKIDHNDEYVSLLPMSWIGEQFMALVEPIVSRHKLNFVESPATTMSDMREVAPTFLLLAPRVWEQIAANVRAQIMDASATKRKLFEWGMKAGVAAVERGERHQLADITVMRALRDRLGFSRLKFATTGGAAMGPDTFKFFIAMGVPLLQLYGQTELIGMYCTQVPGDADYDAVGKGLNEHYQIRIHEADSQGVGEIVARHPHMFKGYFRDEAATRADLRDGWMHTGDAGYFKPSGQLVVIDRLKDLATTVRGERFSPQYIENKLKFSPYVSEAVILGDQREWLSAIICIRFAIVSKWAEQERMSFTTYSDLSSRTEIAGLIATEVRKVNATLPPAQQLRKFVLLYKELDADDGELTRTRKVRRGVVAQKYGEIIDAIYSDRTDVAIDTEIVFQDGSRQRIRTRLPVTTVSARRQLPA